MSKTITTLDMTSDHLWTISIVQDGDSYGREGCLTHDDDDGDDPLVEFHDAEQDPAKFGARGQFVARYSLHTLTERPLAGLLLHGGVPEWHVSAAVVATAIAVARRCLIGEGEAIR